MKFTELTLARQWRDTCRHDFGFFCVFFLCLAALLSGCQFAPSTEKVEGVTNGVTEANEVVVRSPNPYLTNPPSVSAEVKARFQSANTAMADGQWPQAEQHLLWLTENYFELSGPWVNLALLYIKTDQPEKAESAFKQAIGVNGKNIYALNQYGIFLRQQGRFPEAEASYQQALLVWPDYPDGHLNLAILYDLFMGKLEPALKHYQIYQSLQDQADRQVNGWIIDTQRRIKIAAAKGEK